MPSLAASCNAAVASTMKERLPGHAPVTGAAGAAGKISQLSVICVSSACLESVW